jgi:hypothetical protein
VGNNIINSRVDSPDTINKRVTETICSCGCIMVLMALISFKLDKELSNEYTL